MRNSIKGLVLCTLLAFGGLGTPAQATETQQIVVASVAEGSGGSNEQRVPRPNINMGTANTTVESMVLEIGDATQKQLLEYDVETGTLYFDIAQYNQLSVNEKREYMKSALPYISDSSLDKMYKNRFYNFVSKQDVATTKIVSELDTATKSNLVEAGRLIAPASEPISVVSGLLVILVFVFLGFTTVMDMVFMTVPMARGALKRRKGKGGEDTNSEGKYYLVSPEAVYSVAKEEESSGEVSAMVLYLKKRTLKFIFLGLIIVWFMQGEILQMIIFFVEAFKPLFEAFTFGG